MSSASRITLDYAAPAARPWKRLVLIVTLSLAAGWAGRLCSRKFSGPLRIHLAGLDAQASLVRGAAMDGARGMDLPAHLDFAPFTFDCTCKLDAATEARWRRLEADATAVLQAAGMRGFSAWPGTLLWAGELSAGSGHRRVVVITVQVDGSPLQTNRDRPNDTITASIYVVRPGSMFSPLGLAADPQLSSFLTTRRGAAEFRRAEHDPTSPSRVLVDLDDAQTHRRFAFQLAGDDSVSVVEMP